MMFNGIHSGGFFPYGLVIQLLIFIAFFVIVWWVLQSNKQTSNSHRPKETPEEILKKRLAKGEITIKEYENLKQELE